MSDVIQEMTAYVGKEWLEDMTGLTGLGRLISFEAGRQNMKMTREQFAIWLNTLSAFSSKAAMAWIMLNEKT